MTDTDEILMDRDSRIAAITCIALHSLWEHIDQAASAENREWRSSTLAPAIAALPVDNELEMQRLLSARRDRSPTAVDPEAISMALIAASLRRDPNSGEIIIDLRKVFGEAAKRLEDAVILSEWLPGHYEDSVEFNLKELANVEPLLAPSKPLGVLVSRFFKTHKSSFSGIGYCK